MICNKVIGSDVQIMSDETSGCSYSSLVGDRKTFIFYSAAKTLYVLGGKK